MNTARSHNRGFTLMETLTVAAIAGLSLSLAVPSMTSVLSDQRRAGTINQFVTAVQLARSTAITRNSTVSLCASNDGETCNAVEWESGWIAFLDEDLDRRAAQNDVLLVGTAAGNGISIRSDELVAYFSYRANGQIMVDDIDENTGQFTICDNRGAASARVLAITVAGHARLADRQANGRAPLCPA